MICYRLGPRSDQQLQKSIEDMMKDNNELLDEEDLLEIERNKKNCCEKYLII